MTSLATCVLLGALVGTGHAEQSPAPTATLAPSSADSMATVQSADSLAKVPAVQAPAPLAAPAAVPAAVPAAAPVAVPAPAQSTPPKKASPIYFGGTVGFTFLGDVTRLYVQPMVGYKLTPKLSVGGKVGYEHLKDSRYINEVTSDNWGASVFGRFKLLPILYAHAEYAIWSYDTGGSSESVPFMLVGGGYVKRLGPKMALTVEALFDVLQDANSPYRDGEPWVTVGVGVGF